MRTDERIKAGHKERLHEQRTGKRISDNLSLIVRPFIWSPTYHIGITSTYIETGWYEFLAYALSKADPHRPSSVSC